MASRSTVIRRPTLALVLCLTTVWIGSPNAFADAPFIYKCEQRDASGNTVTEYGNGTTLPTGCKRIDVTTAPLVTIPAPKLPAAGSTAARPSGFPKIDGAAQRARDDDRRRVLESELKVQEDKLADLRREYNNGEPERRGDERNYQKYLDRLTQLKEDIGRGEANVASLRRELSTLRDATGASN